LLGGIPAIAQTNAIPLPTTVSEAVFRSRWEGVQADSGQRRSAAAMLGIAPEKGLLSPMRNVAESLREGLNLGPLDIHPGIGFGWEYSNLNSNEQPTSAGSDNSFFVAPTILLQYARDIGPWSINAGYSAGLRYYLNKNYHAAGTGSERNPFSQTGNLSIGHIGTRHVMNVNASGSAGTGLNISTGQNQNQRNLGIEADYSYILTTYTNAGATASYTTSMTNGGTGDDGTIARYSGSLFADWLVTGKTRLSTTFSFGQNSQDLQNSPDLSRQYVQTMVGIDYTLTEKIKLDAGLGASYVTNRGVPDQKQSYVGLRPAYHLGITYEATEKTSVRARLGFQDADIRPTFRLEARWQPRVNTGLVLAIYQTEGFSLDAASQVQVSRGIIGTVSQRLFSKIDLILSAGWEQTENLSLSNTGAANAQNGTEWSYGFVSAGFVWSFNNWSSWSTQLWTSNGNNSPGQSQNALEHRATVSFNLTF